ncbi:MarR family winged helix-turn-helix transcriptional regulator [Beduini massiliensis]|uniref:MarR family winged helix-turn-helix transcriptional regulator n=1 Tax=Beduini massiliensis TaxID=1585974 RepID=UPI00059A8DF8|nr:MarR family transcriptional regulator [Beduini massiliensis]
MDYSTLKNDLFHILVLNQKSLKPYENKSISKLTMLQFRTLCVLNIEGDLSLNELAKIQNITKQQQSLIIKSLVSVGYVSRMIDEADRRVIRFNITDDGKQLLDDQLSGMVNKIVERFKSLDEDKQKELYAAIHSICMILKEIA